MGASQNSQRGLPMPAGDRRKQLWNIIEEITVLTICFQLVWLPSSQQLTSLKRLPAGRDSNTSKIAVPYASNNLTEPTCKTENKKQAQNCAINPFNNSKQQKKFDPLLKEVYENLKEDDALRALFDEIARLNAEVVGNEPDSEKPGGLLKDIVEEHEKTYEENSGWLSTPMFSWSKEPTEHIDYQQSEIFPELMRKRRIIKEIVEKKLRDEILTEEEVEEFLTPAQIMNNQNLDAGIVKPSPEDAPEIEKIIRTAADRKLTEKEKLALIRLYITKVIFPMQAYLALLWNFHETETDNPIEDLMLKIPEELVAPNSEEQLQIEVGPDNKVPYGFILSEADAEGLRKLKYDPVEQFQRHIRYILRAPTPANWLRSMKWMALAMIISQIRLTKVLLRDKSPISVPRQCRNSIGLYLPDTLKFSLPPKKTINERRENILKNTGLTAALDNFAYQKFYTQNISADPTLAGYSANLPFERLHNTMKALKENIDVGIDDFRDSGTVMKMLWPKLKVEFESAAIKASRHYKSSEREKIAQKYYELWGEELTELLSSPKYRLSYELPDGNEESIPKAGRTAYMCELMAKTKTNKWTKIVPKKIINDLLHSEIRIDMPPLYGPSSLKHWALKNLAEAMTRNQFTTDGRFWDIFSDIADISSDRQSQKDFFDIIMRRIEKFRSPHSETPNFMLHKSDFVKIYPILTKLWARMRDNGFLPEAIESEWDHLYRHMESQNIWAAARLSYLIKMYAFDIEEDISEKNANGKNAAYDPEIIEIRKEAFRNAGKILGLDLPFRALHANRILDKDEKEALWRNIIQEEDAKNVDLFAMKIGTLPNYHRPLKWWEHMVPFGLHESDRELFSPTEEDNRPTYYEMFDKVNSMTILDQMAVEDALSQLPISEPGKQKILQETENILEGEEWAKIASIMWEIYQNRGNLKEQLRLFKILKERHDFEGESIKEAFLMLDTALKKPIYLRLMDQAAQLRLGALQSVMQELCALEPEDVDNFRRIFFATILSQDKINQLHGLPPIPKDLMDKARSEADRWTSHNWRQLGAGLAGVPLMIAASALTGACVGTMGLTCILLSGAAFGAAITGGMEVRRSLDEKIATREWRRSVDNFMELGLSSQEASDEMEVSWFWTGLDMFFMWNVYGAAARGLSIPLEAGGSMAKKSLSKLKSVFKKGSNAVDNKTLKYLFGGEGLYVFKRGIYDSFRRSVHSVNIKQAKSLMGLRKFLFMVSGVLPDNMRKINEGFAKMMGRYYGDDLNKLEGLLNKTVYKRMLKNKYKLSKLTFSSRTKMFSRARRLLGINGFTNWRINKIKHALEREGSLPALIDEIRLAAKDGRTMEEFILGSYRSGARKGKPIVDDLCEVIDSLPFRMRELPYLALFQGGPPINLRLIPLFDSILTKRMAQARNNLMREFYQKQAKIELGLAGDFYPSKTDYRIFEGMQTSIMNAVARFDQIGEYDKAKKILADYQKYQRNLAENIKSYFGQKRFFSKKIANMKVDEIINTVFNPSSLREVSKADAILKRIPDEMLFDKKDLPEGVHLAVKELMNYSNVDECQHFIDLVEALWKKHKIEMVFEL
jgi:hypothetical protein